MDEALSASCSCCSCRGPCLDQVNLDFESEKDMIEKFRVGLALQPIANALFASSPFKEGKPSGWVNVVKHRSYCLIGHISLSLFNCIIYQYNGVLSKS